MDKQWIGVLRVKAAEVRLLADWAHMAQLGVIRDALRGAAFNIEAEINRLEGRTYTETFEKLRQLSSGGWDGVDPLNRE